MTAATAAIGKWPQDVYKRQDGQFITGRGAGVAIDFGLAIAAEFAGQAKADAIRASLQCR